MKTYTLSPVRVVGLGLAALALFLIFSLAPSVSEAETVGWAQSYPGYYLFQPDIMSDPRVRVNYVGTIENVATGKPVACGSTVPQGTRLRMTFKAHEPTDVSWFVTGGGWDSPYGVWTTNASQPRTSDMCALPWTASSAYLAYALQYTVAPPQKYVSGLDTTCEKKTNGSYVCVGTLNTPGTVNATMHFGQTTSAFYAAAWYNTTDTTLDTYPYACTRVIGPNNWGHPNKPNVKYMTVPEKRISCPITVEGTPTNNPPSDPQFVANSSCSYDITSGTYEQTVTVRATDPDGDDVLVNVDWTGGGVANQSTGFQPSGSTFTLTKSWSTPGTKTFSVQAEDGGMLTSGWVSGSAECVALPPPPPPPPSDDTADDEPTNNATCGDGTTNRVEISANRPVVRFGETAEISWCSNDATSCVLSSNLGSSSETVGTSGDVTTPALERETRYSINCTMDDGSSISDTLNIKVLPRVQET